MRTAKRNTAKAKEPENIGTDESSVGVASQEIHDAVDSGLGMKLISIRLPISLIEEFKIIADYNHVGYQPLIRNMLKRCADAELKRIGLDLYHKQRTN